MRFPSFIEKKFKVILLSIATGVLIFFLIYRFFLSEVLYSLLFFQKDLKKKKKDIETNIQAFKEKETLLNQIEELKKEHQKYLLLKEQYKALKYENEKLKALLHYSQKFKGFTPVLSQVLSYPLNKNQQIITIYGGKGSRISIGDMVIGDGYLVGRVIQVGRHSSQVLLASDANFKITARTRLTGEVVYYDGEGKLDFVKLDQDIRVGDIIDTFGSKDIPKGIPIGKITDVKTQKGALVQQVKIKPFVKPFKLDYLVILTKQHNKKTK